MASSILFFVGASGVGKTAAVHQLESLALAGVDCEYFDSIGVPSAEVMQRDFGSGEAWLSELSTDELRLLLRLDVSVAEGRR